jgi:hypothetical protein
MAEAGWIGAKSIDDILKLDFDVAISGHGPIVTKQQVLNIRNKIVRSGNVSAQ